MKRTILIISVSLAVLFPNYITAKTIDTLGSAIPAAGAKLYGQTDAGTSGWIDGDTLRPYIMSSQGGYSTIEEKFQPITEQYSGNGINKDMWTWRYNIANPVNTQPGWEEALESRYWPPSGPGAVAGQLEYYKQFYSLDKNTIFRPFNITVDLATNSSEVASFTDKFSIADQSLTLRGIQVDTRGGSNSLLTLQGRSGQTGSIIDFYDTTGSLASSIKSDGNMVMPNITGGTAADASLTLSSSSNANKGAIVLGTSVYDDGNNRLGIANSSPQYPLDVTGDINTTGNLYFNALHRIYNDSNNLYLSNGSSGYIGLSTEGGTGLYVRRPASGIRVVVATGGANTTGMVTYANSGQAVDMQQWTSSGGVVMAAIGATGGLTITPPASATPAVNGQLTFEATSNTSLTVKLKGSDGVVRSAALTLAP